MAELLWQGKFVSLEQVGEYFKALGPLYSFNQQPDDAPKTTSEKNKIPYNIELINHAYTSYLNSFDFRAYLKKVKANTLIIAGENDWIIDPSEAFILNKGISRSQLTIFDKCGHLPWQDQKKNFFSALDSFLGVE